MNWEDADGCQRKRASYPPIHDQIHTPADFSVAATGGRVAVQKEITGKAHKEMQKKKKTEEKKDKTTNTTPLTDTYYNKAYIMNVNRN